MCVLTDDEESYYCYQVDGYVRVCKETLSAAVTSGVKSIRRQCGCERNELLRTELQQQRHYASTPCALSLCVYTYTQRACTVHYSVSKFKTISAALISEILVGFHPACLVSLFSSPLTSNAHMLISGFGLIHTATCGKSKYEWSS